MVNTEVKGNLAKLLATENLNVEHRAVATAYFDIEKRVLCLPIWKDVSNDVYDMLVGHEVGHALYTPLDYGEARLEVPGDILNVLEDVRVEKLMKRRYPGLSRSFFKGYCELDQKDFFELEGKNLSRMALIDRINVHYKVGVIGNRNIVDFEEDETQWVNRAADTESFEDVVELGKELVEYLNRKKEEKIEVPVNVSAQSGSTSGQGQGQGENEEMTHEEMLEKAKQREAENDISVNMDGGVGGSWQVHEPVDEMKSETYQALEENQQNLVDQDAREYLYLNIPQLDLEQTIIPFKKVFASFTEYVNRDDLNFREATFEFTQKYREYKRESIKSVNYLVKEFECKKAADQYARASTSRTGVLDTSRLHSYKLSDDVFKKVTTTPDGKNHGLVFYLDWSGSMSNCMISTIKQLYDLIWFCKKVSIPFRVYAFSDSCANERAFPGIPSENKQSDLHIDDNFRLFEFFSSKMNAQTLDSMMAYLYINCEGFRRVHDYNQDFQLSGTPLVETIVSTPQVVEKFKSEEKVEKVNVIYLTDGEAANPMYNVHISALGKVYSQPMFYYTHTPVLRDPKSRYSRQLCSDISHTNQFVDFISNIVNYNFLGFRLCGKSEIRKICRDYEINTVQFEKQWEKTKCAAIPNCGFKELYLLPLPKNQLIYKYWTPGSEEVDDLAVENPSSKAQLTSAFKKHMNGKMVNKTILSKFAGQIA